MKNNRKNKKAGRKNKQWFKNPDQLKHPKVFTLKMVRMPDKSFHIIGGETKVFIQKNGVSGEWYNCDTRDFGVELRNSPIYTR